MTAPKKWRPSRDPLLRGDAITGVRAPVATANDSIIRHVLYLEGPGRETPYLSTSESMAAASRFAQAGVVWKTLVKKAQANGVGHIGNSELLSLMKGNGKRKAKWDAPSRSCRPGVTSSNGPSTSWTFGKRLTQKPWLT